MVLEHRDSHKPWGSQDLKNTKNKTMVAARGGKARDKGFLGLSGMMLLDFRETGS